MINVGIDVHKRKCFATVKGPSRQILQQITLDNNFEDTMRFIKEIRQRYGTPMRAVYESTVNYWIRLHDTLEENGIDTVLPHPAKTMIIAQARLKNDRLNSKLLADLPRSDMICELFVPGRESGSCETLSGHALDW